MSVQPMHGKSPRDIYDPGFTRHLFDTLSGAYDLVNFITSFGFSRRWRRQLVKHIPAKNHMQVVDLLSGKGETWAAIQQGLPGSVITAIDISPGMLAEAKSKKEDSRYKHVIILQEDILSAQLPQEQYDAVVCAFGLKFFTPQQLAIIAGQTSQLLRPGGHFAFIEVSKPNNALLYALYGFHLRYIVPFVALLCSRNARDFGMLWHYADNYNNSLQAAQLFTNAGLITTYDSYFFGCATGIHGYKPHS